MNPSSQPPPVPCSKCGGRLRKISAFNFKCESCGSLSRRVLDPETKALFIMVKLGFLGLALLPTVMAASMKMKPEDFFVLSAVCSLIAGLGLTARMVRWWFTLLGGFGLGGGLFVMNLIAGSILGCKNLF